jgi:hypothetical protein
MSLKSLNTCAEISYVGKTLQHHTPQKQEALYKGVLVKAFRILFSEFGGTLTEHNIP